MLSVLSERAASVRLPSSTSTQKPSSGWMAAASQISPKVSRKTLTGTTAASTPPASSARRCWSSVNRRRSSFSIEEISQPIPRIGCGMNAGSPISRSSRTAAVSKRIIFILWFLLSVVNGPPGSALGNALGFAHSPLVREGPAASPVRFPPENHKTDAVAKRTAPKLP